MKHTQNEYYIDFAIYDFEMGNNASVGIHSIKRDIRKIRIMREWKIQ